MKSNLKIMLLGIVFMISGVCVRCIYIGYLYNTFIELVWIILPIIGFVVFLFGFFDSERHDELTEKIYKMISDKQRKEEMKKTCEKCGETYAEGYSSCPWCGYKNNNT